MKDNRTFVKKYKGWPGESVEFLSTYENGATQTNTCSLEEWEAYEIKVKLVEAGADEDLVNKLWDKGYSYGYEWGSLTAEAGEGL